MQSSSKAVVGVHRLVPDRCACSLLPGLAFGAGSALYCVHESVDSATCRHQVQLGTALLALLELSQPLLDCGVKER
jgi:hypothetical protein